MQDAKNNTALWFAVSNQHLQAVEILLVDIGVNPDTNCELGNTVLHKALMMDQVLPEGKK